MQDRSHLLTEQQLDESADLDAMPIADAVAMMNRHDLLAVTAVGAESANITQAIELVVTGLRAGGSLYYVGAGTSGRLGVLDASECPPTFRSDPEMVQGIIAGGEAAMFKSQEGAEDRSEDGAAAIDRKKVGVNDVVMGIAAGGTTPFVHGALWRARERGARTIFLTCIQDLPQEPHVDVTIRPLTGPEVVTGSTRLKAGTATKLVLNTISTLAMVQLGKVHGNLMVDLRATNTKLRDRGARIVSTVTGISRTAAMDKLEAAGGHVKLAIVMESLGLTASAAQIILDRNSGNLRTTLTTESSKRK